MDEDASYEQMLTALAALVTLERRGVVTFDKTQADTCCGIKRDADGFCHYRPYHPIYVDTQPDVRLIPVAELEKVVRDASAKGTQYALLHAIYQLIAKLPEEGI